MPWPASERASVIPAGPEPMMTTGGTWPVRRNASETINS